MSDNATENTLEKTHQHFNTMLFMELLVTAVAITSVVANVFTSFVILKYERLRRDPANILMVHINLMELLFLFSATIYLWTENLEIYIGGSTSCLWFEVQFALIFCVFLLLILITTDGCMVTCSKDRYPKCRRIFTYLYLAMTYGLTVAVAYGLSNYCTTANNMYAVTLYFDILVSLGVLALVFVMNIIHRIKMCRLTDRLPNNVGLAIANIYMLCWMTVYPPVLVAVYADEPGVLDVLISIAVVATVATPIFKLIYLYRCDDYKTFLKRTCSCGSNNHESVLMREDSVVYIKTGCVLIPKRRHVTGVYSLTGKELTGRRPALAFSDAEY